MRLGEGTIIPIFGEKIEILVTSTDSNNTFVVAVQTSPAGGGPPPHRHLREEEVFTVVKGEYEVFNGVDWIPLKQGETAISLRGHYHGFRNVGPTEGKMMFFTNGGGLDEYFKLISPLKLPDNMQRFTEISDHFGYEYLPPEDVKSHV